MTPSRGRGVNECGICWLPASALDASATMAVVGTSDTTQDAERAKCASAKNDCESDALRYRDRLSVIAGLPVRFRESDGRRKKVSASNKTLRFDADWTCSRPQYGSKPAHSPFLPCNMTVTDELVWRVSCLISTGCRISLQYLLVTFSLTGGRKQEEMS
mgnify:CR=1 FL=1